MTALQTVGTVLSYLPGLISLGKEIVRAGDRRKVVTIHILIGQGLMVLPVKPKRNRTGV